MKRLDIIAEWLFEDSEHFVMEHNNSRGYLLVFRPCTKKYRYGGKITISFKRKPNKLTVKKSLIKEIKLRCLDDGWYRSGLRSLLRVVYFDTIVVRDDFSKQKVELTGYRTKNDPGLYNDYTGALCGFLGCSYWETYCGY